MNSFVSRLGFHLNVLLLILAMACFSLAEQAAAEKDGSANAAVNLEHKSAAQKTPTMLSELEANCDKTPGLLEIWRNRNSGEAFLLVKEDQLKQPLIYFTYVESGLSRFFLGRGVFRGQRMLTISRDYQRLRFQFEPTRYYFDPHSPLRFAADANVSPAMVAAEPIIAWDESRSRFAVSADKLFLNDAWDQLKPFQHSKESKQDEFQLGELNREKSRFRELRGYPQNIDLVVDYVFQNQAPKHHPPKDEGVTDSRYVTVTAQHSIIAAPQNDYLPRRDDPRIGFFAVQMDDMTSTSATPYRDVICRWHLQHSNKDVLRGPPKEPIVWWLERSTPKEFRETIRAAVLAWNEAFSQAGFEHAVEVRIQPDEADWNAGDLRYNVIRWTSSPAPVFGGYGPSFVDPRTGQILGADIMLEWVFVTNRIRYRDIYRQPTAMNPFHLQDTTCPRACSCSLSAELQMANLFGRHVLNVRGASTVEQDELLKQSLYYLVLHEVGHTLGLSHNFKSSQLLSLEEIHNSDIASQSGLTSSVMEYPNINVAPLDRAQGLFYTTKPGAYDRWAIEFGYSPSLDDPVAEEERLQTILARSTQPELAFANDADDMRRPGKGIDPGAMLYDMSSDPVGWAEERFAILQQLRASMLDNYQRPGQSYQELRDQFAILLRQFKTAAEVTSRYPGGVRVDRAVIGQANAGKPLQPVDRSLQQRAVQVLASHVFAPDAFSVSPDLFAHLQKQRRGFDHFEENEDFRIHDMVLEIHQYVLEQLLHHKTLKRISDSSMYGNTYSLHEFLTDLTAAIFSEDANGKVNTIRQNLQSEYVRRLVAVLGNPAVRSKHQKSQHGGMHYDGVARSGAWEQLYQIELQLERSLNSGGDGSTTAHQKHLKWIITRAMES